jgi:hypothetical protein
MISHMSSWVPLSKIQKVFWDFNLKIPQAFIIDNGAYAAGICGYITSRHGARAGHAFALMCAGEKDYFGPHDAASCVPNE